MGNAVVFAKAFKECGIGGKFSKFHIAQTHEWFELINIDRLEDSRFCFKVYDRLDTRPYTQVTGGDAGLMHKDDPQWATHFQTAQKVIAKIVSRDNNRGETRYYIDYTHRSIYLVNRMFVIEVAPVLRNAPAVSSYAAFEFLNVYMKEETTSKSDVRVYTRYGKVVVYCDNRVFNSLLTIEEFNEQFGEPV